MHFPSAINDFLRYYKSIVSNQDFQVCEVIRSKKLIVINSWKASHERLFEDPFLISFAHFLTAVTSTPVQASAPPLESAISRSCEAVSVTAPQPLGSPSTAAAAPQDQSLLASLSPATSPVATTPLSPHKENIPVSNHVNNRWALVVVNVWLIKDIWKIFVSWCLV